jgi:hypothetical protein
VRTWTTLPAHWLLGWTQRWLWRRRRDARGGQTRRRARAPPRVTSLVGPSRSSSSLGLRRRPSPQGRGPPMGLRRRRAHEVELLPRVAPPAGPTRSSSTHEVVRASRAREVALPVRPARSSSSNGAAPPVGAAKLARRAPLWGRAAGRASSSWDCAASRAWPHLRPNEIFPRLRRDA